MSTTAIFTGAGASKAFGLPLTDELLPIITSRLESGELFNGSQDELETFSKCLDIILPGFRNVDKNALPLLTDLLSLVDHFLASRSSLTPIVSGKMMSDFRVLLERAILEVLLARKALDSEPSTLSRMSDWLSAKIKSNDQIGIISTNYDIELESELFKKHDRKFINQNFDFGFSWRDTFSGEVQKRPSNPFVRFYKLHGSFNWLRCDLCDHVYINTYGSIVDLAYQRVSTGNTCHCGYAPLRSLLIAPSIVRDIREVNLLECWKSAIEFLRTADEWIIIGYSLPPEDIAIRSLFLRAYNARRDAPRVRIIQKGAAQLSRYKLFFPHCVYESGGLEDFINKEFTPLQ